MMLRTQIAALAVLVVALGVVFVAVGDAGVKTDVSLWKQIEPDRYEYTGPADADAVITISTLDQEFEPDTDPSDTLLGIMQQLAGGFMGQGYPVNGIQAPTIENIQGVPVGLMRISVAAPFMSATQQTVQPTDEGFAFVKQSDEKMTWVRYTLDGAPNDDVYNAFRLWVGEHAAELAVPREEEVAAPDEPEDADAALAKWQELQPNTFQYMPDTSLNVRIATNQAPVDQLASQIGLSTPLRESPVVLLDILGELRAGYEQSLEQDGLQAGPDAITGPAVELVSDVPVAFLRFTLEPQVLLDGTDFAGVDLFVGLVDDGTGQVTIVQYEFRGESNPTVYADFRAWLAAKVTEWVAADEEPADDADADAPADEETPADEPADDADVEAPAEDETPADTPADEVDADAPAEDEAPADAPADDADADAPADEAPADEPADAPADESERPID